MGLIKLAIKSLKTDFIKSLFYFLSFLLTTIFIFLFFNLTFNPATGLELGRAKLITTIATFVILIAMLCVFMANDFYVFAKSKDISVVLMSGASVYQAGIYLLLQSIIIMMIAIPLGFVISYILVPVINGMMTLVFDYSGSIDYISHDALVATAIILLFEVGWCTLLNMGYCYRTSVNSLAKSNIEIEKFSLGIKKLSNRMYLVLFILPMFLFLYFDDPSSYLLVAIIGIVGVYGLIKKIIPKYIEKRQNNESLENRWLLITLGNIRYDLQKVRMLVLIITIAAIILMCTTVYTIDEPLVSMITLLSYFSVMILLAITSIYKIGMELQSRKRSFMHLYYMGYVMDDLKKIINLEMIIFYGIIIVIPLLYQIIIVIKLYSIGVINLYLILIMLLIQIIPMLICMLICTVMYKRILPVI